MLSEEKLEILARVEMLEMDKKKMGERLYNLQEANLLKSQQVQVNHCYGPPHSALEGLCYLTGDAATLHMLAGPLCCR